MHDIGAWHRGGRDLSQEAANHGEEGELHLDVFDIAASPLNDLENLSGISGMIAALSTRTTPSMPPSYICSHP
jgi:hypothetical protein